MKSWEMSHIFPINQRNWTDFRENCQNATLCTISLWVIYLNPTKPNMARMQGILHFKICPFKKLHKGYSILALTTALAPLFSLSEMLSHAHSKWKIFHFHLGRVILLSSYKSDKSNLQNIQLDLWVLSDINNLSFLYEHIIGAPDSCIGDHLQYIFKREICSYCTENGLFSGDSPFQCSNFLLL